MSFNFFLKSTAILSLCLSVTSLSIRDAFASSNNAMTTTHVMDTSAFPNNGRANFATHRFQLHVVGKSLNALEITIPNGIYAIKEVEIKDNAGRLVNVETSFHKQQINLDFAQPVTEKTILLIKLKGVNTRGIAKTWQYHLSGKLDNISEFIPLGTVRIQTHEG